MKRILYSLCIGSVILGLAASGATAAKPAPKKKGSGKASAQVVSPAKKGKTAVRRTAVRSTGVRSTGKARVQRSVARPRATSKATLKRSSVRSDRGRTIRQPTVATKSKVRASRNVAARSKARPSRDVTLNRERAFRQTGEAATVRDRSFRTDRAAKLERSRNVRITNNWRDRRFAGTQYAAFRDYRRSYHHRDWYTHNYSRIIFVSGGWWYWNSGYWYPAWGYASNAYYPYDGPIYTGYANLAPDQVIVNVQIQLQRDGYYVGAIDGILGPMTRRALAAFQLDNGLAVTSTIDQPTLSVLGV
jgi:hypothetical protein